MPGGPGTTPPVFIENMNTCYQRTAASDEWYTPREIVEALGRFALDPCAPVHPLYQTADRMVNKNQDGLKVEWGGYGYGATLHIASL